MDFEDVIKLMSGARESGLYAEIATTLFTFKEELIAAGFTPEQAMQIIVQHGMNMGLNR